MLKHTTKLRQAIALSIVNMSDSFMVADIEKDKKVTAILSANKVKGKHRIAQVNNALRGLVKEGQIRVAGSTSHGKRGRPCVIYKTV